MSVKFDLESDESNADTIPDLSELRQQIQLSPVFLQQITQKDEFVDKVLELNEKAKQKILEDQSKAALIYLNEAQKILEYAANRCKSIPRSIIVYVLHNQASCYQKLWELEKCSNYLEALLYNLNRSSDREESVHQQVTKSASEYEIERKSNVKGDDQIVKSFAIAKYHLQFSAINSQLGNHSGALASAKKAIDIIKNSLKCLNAMPSVLKRSTSESQTIFDKKTKILSMITNFQDMHSLTELPNIRSLACHSLYLFQNEMTTKDMSDYYFLEQEFKNYSIGNIMQIVPMGKKQIMEVQKINGTLKEIIEIGVLFAVAYFVVATQLRLIAEKYHKSTEEKINSTQYKESEMNHLFSIILAIFSLPFEILYLKHVVSSYSKHYPQSILESKPNLDIELQILFPLPKNTPKNQRASRKCLLSQSIIEFNNEQVENISQKKNMLSPKSKHKFHKNKNKKESIDGHQIISHHRIKSMRFSQQFHQSLSKQKNHPTLLTPNHKHKKSSSNCNLFKFKSSYRVRQTSDTIKIFKNRAGKDQKEKLRQSQIKTTKINAQLAYEMKPKDPNKLTKQKTDPPKHSKSKSIRNIMTMRSVKKSNGFKSPNPKPSMKQSRNAGTQYYK